MLQADRRAEYISYCASSMLAFIFTRIGAEYVAGIVFLLEALFLYISNFRKSGNLVDLRGIFSLSWIGGEGIACLKLSHLSSPLINVLKKTFHYHMFLRPRNSI